MTTTRPSDRAVSLLGVALAAFGCSVESPSGAEQIETTSSAVLGPSCSGSTSNCWELAFLNAANHSTFAYGPHIECGIPALGKKQVFCRSTAAGGFAVLAANWGSDPIDLPVESQSIAISSSYVRDTGIHVLGTDSVVRSTYGDATQPAYSGTNFKAFTGSTSAIDLSNGQPICLTKIATVTLPALYAPSWALIGLTCSSYASNPRKLYVRGINGWLPSTSSGIFSSLSGAITWTDISHSAMGGAYLLSSTGDVWWTAWGTVALDGTVHYSAPVKLPPLPPSSTGTTIKPTAVGGPFVVTDAGTVNFYQCGQPGYPPGCPGDEDRFFRFVESTNQWVHAGQGVPLAATSVGEVYYSGGNAYYPFYRQIFDARSLNGTGDEFGTFHSYSRIYRWTNHVPPNPPYIHPIALWAAQIMSVLY